MEITLSKTGLNFVVSQATFVYCNEEKDWLEMYFAQRTTY